MANLSKMSWILIGATLILSVFIVFFAFTDPEGIMIYVMLVITMSLLSISLVLVFIGRNITAEMEYDGLDVRGPMLSLKISYGDITSTELRNHFNPGIRVGGYGGIDRLGGNFRNKEFGTYKLGVLMSVKSYIVIKYKENKVLVFNLKDIGQTSNFYSALKKKVGK